MKIARIAVAGALLAALAIVTLFLSLSRPLTPATIMADALKLRADGELHLFIRTTYTLADGRKIEAAEAQGELRGLTIAEAEALLNSCANIADWKHVGDEAPRLLDGAMLNGNAVYNRYSIMVCDHPNGVLLARLNMTRELVDRRVELVHRSEFLACKPMQCPDVAVGDLGTVDPFDPVPRFKIAGPAKP